MWHVAFFIRVAGCKIWLEGVKSIVKMWLKSAPEQEKVTCDSGILGYLDHILWVWDAMQQDVVKYELSCVQKKCVLPKCAVHVWQIGSDYLKDSMCLKCGLANFSFVSFRKKKWFYVVWHIGSDYLMRHVAKIC